MKHAQNQLRTGTVLSYISLFLSSAIPFFYTPVVLSCLGQAEYGLYALSGSTISCLSLLSFGFGSTILRYLSMYRAQERTEDVQKIFGFFLLLYCGVAVLILLGGAIVSANVSSVFKQGLTADERTKLHSLLTVMAVSSALSFPNSVFSSVIIAHERYIFRKLADMLTTVLLPLGNLAALYMGFGSVGMAVSSMLLQLLMLPVNGLYCFRVLNVRPKFTPIPPKLIREMVRFSVFVWITTIVDLLFWSTDKVLLGMYAGSAAVAVYNIGCTFNTMVQCFSTSISNILTPRVTAMVTLDASRKQLTDLFIRVGRIQFLIVALLVSGFTVFGQSFLTLWAGSEFTRSYWIAIATMIPLCVPLIQNTGISIVTAQNKHQFYSVMYLLIAIANVLSTYLVIPRWGGLGAAVCSGVSYILGQGICMNLYYWKVTGLNIPLFWRNILKMSIVPLAMAAAGLYIVRVHPCNNWLSFFLAMILYTGIYGIFMYLISMNQSEKDEVYRILRKILTNNS